MCYSHVYKNASKLSVGKNWNAALVYMGTGKYFQFSKKSNDIGICFRGW